MATAKKVAAKAAPKKKVEFTPAKKAPAKKLAVEYIPPKKVVRREQEFSMPMEVKDWIDQAMSRLKSMQSKVDRLEAENKELKSYKRWAEHRILNSSPE
jgi:hypothetical protein